MRQIRKYFSNFFLIISLVLFFLCITVSAEQKFIYQYSIKQPIAAGASLEKISRFTDDGWLGINVIKVDLTNPNIMIDAISNPDSVQMLTSPKILAESKGAVAVINGGFYDGSKQPGMGPPIGPMVEAGKLVSAHSESNVNTAVFSIDNLNQPLCSYWKINMTLIAPNGNSALVGNYNKAYFGQKDLVILDRRWSKMSIGLPGASDIVEMVVDNGKVVEIRQSRPPVEIPKNGYVVIARKESAQFLYQNFKPGTPVIFKIATTPDWTTLKMAITGGAILIKDGQVPKIFSHMNNNPRNPRTAIGSSEDGKQLIMVTVDGRQKTSMGMTLPELAKLMIEFGAYNAINLDGGGSTVMAVRRPGNSKLDLINSPSDGSIRRVATSVAVYSKGTPAGLDSLIIDTRDSNVFVNTSRILTIKGVDKYLNPVEINPAEVQWTVSEIEGSFNGTVFLPKSIGTGKIKAALGNISAELSIESLSPPVQLELSEKSIRGSVNKLKTFSVRGKNKDGYWASIDPADVTWSVKGGVGVFDQQVFRATAGGVGYIDASVGGVHTYCSVSIEALDITTIIDNFETLNASILCSPNTVTGKYEISSEQKHSGENSGKLTYDFSTKENIRTAYLTFKDNGISLDAKTKTIGLWIYNDHESSDRLGAWIYDNSGKQNIVYFTTFMDWNGWKYIEVSLNDITLPARIARIYIEQPNPVTESGVIYLDDLSITASVSAKESGVKIPPEMIPQDDANQKVKYQKSDHNFRFVVFGQSGEPQATLGKQCLTKFTGKISSEMEAAAIVGNSSNATISTKKTVLYTNNGYKSFDIKNCSLIQLDTSKGGLRLTDLGQWHQLLQQLEQTEKHLFIFLSRAPENCFRDKMEADLLRKVLTDYTERNGKKVWVLYKGEQNSSYMDNGVKYISISGFNNEDSPTNIRNTKYIQVTVEGDNLSFELKNIF